MNELCKHKLHYNETIELFDYNLIFEQSRVKKQNFLNEKQIWKILIDVQDNTSKKTNFRKRNINIVFKKEKERTIVSFIEMNKKMYVVIISFQKYEKGELPNHKIKVDYLNFRRDILFLQKFSLSFFHLILFHFSKSYRAGRNFVLC